MLKLGVDVMGSDRSPQELYQAVISAADAGHSDLRLVVFATEDLAATLPKHPSIFIHPVSSTIQMDEDPLTAVRKKRDASMVVGIQQLSNKEIDAFVTAGHTGALVAAAVLTLPKKPGVTRPALMAQLPTKKGKVAVLDVGGNLTCTAAQLYSFAEQATAHTKKRRPSIGLLNVGAEATKGTSTHQEAYQLLEAEKKRWNFVGNVEGEAVFRGVVDILVTDGLTGNVFLKSAEGLAAMIVDELPPDHPLHAQLHSKRSPCAYLLGLEGLIVKCHGSCSPSTFAQAIIQTN